MIHSSKLLEVSTVYGILCHLLFGVTHCHNHSIVKVNFYQVKIVLFYSVQVTNLTFVGQK